MLLKILHLSQNISVFEMEKWERERNEGRERERKRERKREKTSKEQQGSVLMFVQSWHQSPTVLVYLIIVHHTLKIHITK